MESAHSLILNEEGLKEVSKANKPIFILEWLRFLDKYLNSTSKSTIKECQKQLLDELIKQISNNPGPPTRKYIGKCLATLFSVGDTFLLFDAVNRCNDLLKSKDDSINYLPIRLSAILCIGTMYEKLGRLMGRSYEETVTLLLKILKNAESQTRCEIYLTLSKIVAGMGTAASNVHRDIFKAIKHGMVDRVIPVRYNASLCLKEIIKYAFFLYTSELESVFSLCFRAFESSNYEVRCSVAEILGLLIAITQRTSQSVVGKNRLASLEEVLNLLASGFLKGGIGFLKSGAGEMIKGGLVCKETRIGVTHSYVILVYNLGNHWFEKNMSFFLSHLLELLSNPKCATSHMDAVHSRRCVGFILRSILGKHLGEKHQIQAVKELLFLINKYNDSGLSLSTENSNGQLSSSNKETVKTDVHLTQHVLVCALLEIGSLFKDLGTCSICLLQDSSLSFIDTIASFLTNQFSSIRVSAAWCLRCVAIASPSQLTPLIERSLERLETMKASPETIYGYSFTLSALLGSSCQTLLGIPHNKGKLIFSIAEDLLRTASQNSRLSLQKTQSGWQLIGAVITLGPSVFRGLLPRILLLWKNSFPRSIKELDSEKKRGDAFTWQITLENRAGALAAISSFLTYCEKLVTSEVIRRLLISIESAITMLITLGPIFKNYGPLVKANAAMVRLRLYETLLLLPLESLENSYSDLLRLLVSDFTIAESVSNTTTSLLNNLCNSNDVILGSWIQETDHKLIEDQLQTNSGLGYGALEHDVTYLYKPLDKNTFSPSPLPLGVSVINNSCLLFAQIFRFVTDKNQLQMLNHFQKCIKHAKANRQEAIQINILTAVIGALKQIAENKLKIDSEDVKKAFTSLIINMLSHNNPIIRCASAQALGRCCQVVDDSKFFAEVSQLCFDKLKSARDAVSRTGHSLALGCLHRYVGSLGSSQHLNTSISILLALSQDTTSPVVQIWSLHALTLIIDSEGPMFRPYVESTLSQILKLLINVPFYHCDVHHCIGKLLSALITTVGPELQSMNLTVSTIRSWLLIMCAIMQEHNDALVQSQAIACLQQLHMFAPIHVNLSTLVPTLCTALNSQHLFLRRASIACLHQLSQRETKEVCQYADLWLKNNEFIEIKQIKKFLTQTDHGLLGLLFYLYDNETDEKLLNDIVKIVNSLVQSIGPENLHQMLSICKEVLTATDPNFEDTNLDKEGEGENDFDDDESRFKAKNETTACTLTTPKWRTRVFSIQILCKIINGCKNSPDSQYHFNLTLARERRQKSQGSEDFLVLHLSDLIRISFMAATSDSDNLRVEGLQALQLIIDKFSNVPEPEFPDHVILEQYQAQVGAALRPAFSTDTPSDVTAIACQVCSAWIGSGVARDLNDLRRVHQLLVSSLNKLKKDSSSKLYNENASTLEKLAILKAWAEVYIVAMEQEKTSSKSKLNFKNGKDKDDDNLEDLEPINESLLDLVKPELVSLSKYWLSALKDHALLTLPNEFSNQLPYDGGAFYISGTIEMARPIYRKSWPPILHATALWLCSNGFAETDSDSSSENTNYFYLLFGIAMEALCNPKSLEPLNYVIVCLKSLKTLLFHSFSKKILGSDAKLSIELCNVLHRLLLTRDNPLCHMLILDIANLILISRVNQLEDERRKKLREIAPVNQELEDSEKFLSSIGEGGETGEIDTNNSVVYSLLEVCLCVLVRQLPELCPSLANTPVLASIIQKRENLKANQEYRKIFGTALDILCSLPNLCSPKGSVNILPSSLYLINTVLTESANIFSNCRNNEIILMILKCFQRLGTNPLAKNSLCSQEWIQLFQSSLASILDVCKSGDESKIDKIIQVMIIGIFIIYMPPQVLAAPNLQYPCINLLKQALQSTNAEVILECMKTIQNILKKKDKSIKIPYVHAFASKIIKIIVSMVNEFAASNDQTISEVKYNLLLIGLENFELLVNLVENDKQINLLSLYLPLLVTLLMELTPQTKKTSYRYKLHEYAINKLISTGPCHPNEFRAIVGQVPSLKAKLENAVKNQSNLKANVNHSDLNKVKPNNCIIELKTDFSNYSDQST